MAGRSHSLFPYLDRRRARRAGPVYGRGVRVEVLGPFDARKGPGTVRRVCATRSAALIVDLDSGKDVLVPRSLVRPLVDAQ